MSRHTKRLSAPLLSRYGSAPRGHVWPSSPHWRCQLCHWLRPALTLRERLLRMPVFPALPICQSLMSSIIAIADPHRGIIVPIVRRRDIMDRRGTTGGTTDRPGGVVRHPGVYGSPHRRHDTITVRAVIPTTPAQRQPPASSDLQREQSSAALLPRRVQHRRTHRGCVTAPASIARLIRHPVHILDMTAIATPAGKPAGGYPKRRSM